MKTTTVALTVARATMRKRDFDLLLAFMVVAGAFRRSGLENGLRGTTMSGAIGVTAMQTKMKQEPWAAAVEALVKHKARLTGSWARGEETEFSDYDFYVSGRQWKAFVLNAPSGWVSQIVGHIAWRYGDIQIEASRHFKRQRTALTEHIALGKTWKTW